MQCTRFIRKVFATKILLSGKFSLLLTLGLHFKSDKAATERYASSMNDYSLSFLGWEVNTKSPFEDSFGGRAVKNEVSKMSGDSVKCTLSPN